MPQKESVSVYVPRLALIFCLIVSFSVLVGSMSYLMRSGPGPVPVEGKLAILTDKAEYEQGEEVKISVINNTEDEIFLTFPSIEIYEQDDTDLGGGQWRAIRMVWSGCGVAGGLSYLPLSAGGSSVYAWDQKEKWCPEEKPWGARMDFQNARGGKYRISSVIVERTKDVEEDPNNISGQPTDNFVYSNEFTINEISAADPRCGKKVRGIGPCEAGASGYEYDPAVNKCFSGFASGCSFEIPFNSLEECRDVCERKTDYYSCSADSDCVAVRADCCGCNAGGKAMAINNRYIFDWNGKCKTSEPVMCPAVMSDDPSCFGAPKCVNSRCEIINAEKNK